MSKYISVDALQNFCNNQKDHSITPNDFQRMNHIEIIRCKDCEKQGKSMCPIRYVAMPTGDWFCADGVRKQ